MSFRRLVGFGEAMLRLTVRDGRAIETTTSLECSVGGAELNACIAAVRAGMPATWVSALPDDPLARLVRRHVRACGVDAEIVTVEEARLGLYFLEMAPPPRPLRITYDRTGSAFALLDPERIDWRTLLGPDACLLITGITPPLGTGPRKGVEDALAAARDVGATVALDVNYRSALWSRDEAAGWLGDVLPDVDVLSAGADDLSTAGLEGDDPVAEAVRRFGLRAAVTTSKHRVDDAMELEVRVVTPDGEHRAQARAGVVDPIGAGDALFGTFLSRLPSDDLQAATELGLSAAVTCLGLFGDALVDDPWDASEGRGVVR
ncbi:MAG: sugar kinase [Actinomycetota bacterium]